MRMLESVEEEETDPDFLLMCVAIVVVLLLLAVAALCFCDRHYRIFEMVEMFINSSALNRSDEVYGAEMLRRQIEDEERKKEDPEERRMRLSNYFDSKGVAMEINEESYVLNKTHRSLSTHTEHTDVSTIGESTSNSDVSPNDGNDITIGNSNEENGEAEEIYLPTGPESTPRKVPNCCAICLCTYEIGDVVVFSSNFAQKRKDGEKEKHDVEGNDTHRPNNHGGVRGTTLDNFRALFHKQDRMNDLDGKNTSIMQGPCPHAFHRDCILDYLQRQIGTPCPCCRREFTDMVPWHIEQEMSCNRRRRGRDRDGPGYTALRHGNADANGGGTSNGFDRNGDRHVSNIETSAGASARVTIEVV